MPHKDVKGEKKNKSTRQEIKHCGIELHGYTVHQQYPTLQFPTDAHNVKKCRVIKTF